MLGCTELKIKLKKSSANQKIAIEIDETVFCKVRFKDGGNIYRSR